MRNARFWRLAVIITTAGGLSLAGAGQALAGRADTGVTIGAASAFVQVSGDTLVQYGGPAAVSDATVSGSVTGLPANLAAPVVTLLARPFGATAFAGLGQPVPVRPAADGSASYSFTVTPELATEYKVQVSGSAGGPALATSATQAVYVTPYVTVTGGTTCPRPHCTGTLVITATYPPAAFATESAKPLRFYQGIRQSASIIPAAPQRLSLAVTARHDVTDQKHSTVRYHAGYEFNIGPVNGYQWKINYCTANTEAADGVGLPGHHGCGKQFVSATAPYLG
jgi:hypothetical protein